jgi:hypothetical protein
MGLFLLLVIFDADKHSRTKRKYTVWAKFGFLSVKVGGTPN